MTRRRKLTCLTLLYMFVCVLAIFLETVMSINNLVFIIAIPYIIFVLLFNTVFLTYECILYKHQNKIINYIDIILCYFLVVILPLPVSIFMYLGYPILYFILSFIFILLPIIFSVIEKTKINVDIVLRVIIRLLMIISVVLIIELMFNHLSFNIIPFGFY